MYILIRPAPFLTLPLPAWFGRNEMSGGGVRGGGAASRCVGGNP